MLSTLNKQQRDAILGSFAQDSIVLAGAGAGKTKTLITRIQYILQEKNADPSSIVAITFTNKSAKELILQPQSEINEVRKYIRENGYRIVDEDMIEEDQKYYPMMRVVQQEDGEKSEAKETLNHVHLLDLYGPVLLAEKNPVLLEFLQKQEKHYEEILDGLNRQPDSEKICARRDEMKEKLEYNRMAQHKMKNAAV